MVRQPVVALRVIESARDEAREHEPAATGGLEGAERESGVAGEPVRGAEAFEELRKPVRHRAMPGDRAVAGTSRSQALRRRSEDQLEGHQGAGAAAAAGNIGGAARCISQ